MPRFTLQLLLVGLMMALTTGASAKPTVAEVTQKAEQGSAKAQFTLGEIYSNGDGVVADDVEAVKWYLKAAEQDYTRAQAALGFMYTVGRGVAADDAEAIKWLSLAAGRGNATAQYNLGIRYATGKGVPKDSTEAAIWYRAAADQGQGHAKARYNLGVMYATGDGVRKDSEEAVKWYLKAAELNYAKAQCNLGYMYAMGDGVRQDSAEAVKWYRKAAEQGDATALYNLGVMTAVGDGVPKDLVQAHVWLNGAASQGTKDVSSNLAAIERDMTAEQKAEAKQLLSPTRQTEAKGRASGWHATFRPAAGARVDFLGQGGGFRTAVESAACRFGIWVASAGPEAEVEILAGTEAIAAAEARPETFRAVVLQRSDDLIVLKLVMKTVQQADHVQIYTLFPRSGVGFVTTSSADGSGRPDPRDHAMMEKTPPGVSVIPLSRAD